jgi:hypothetical protein
MLARVAATALVVVQLVRLVAGRPLDLAEEPDTRAAKHFLHHPVYSHYAPPRLYRPPINFISNGQPYNIIVNPRQDQLSAPTAAPVPAPQTDSPLIWLTNTFHFNGRPGGVFSLRPPWLGGWGLRG